MIRFFQIRFNDELLLLKDWAIDKELHNPIKIRVHDGVS